MIIRKTYFRNTAICLAVLFLLMIPAGKVLAEIDPFDKDVKHLNWWIEMDEFEERDVKSLEDFVMKGKLNVHPRIFYMNRHFDNVPDNKTQESMAVGGWISYETAPVYGLSAGGTGYLAQPFIFTDSDRSGAGVLGPHQKGYGVFGEAYVRFRARDTIITVFRQALDTPFINRMDSRIIPVTYEAYTLRTKDIDKFDIMVSHVTQIKTWTSKKFIPMSKAAGIEGTSEPVTMAGVVFSPTDRFSVQAWDYYCWNFMNVLYLESDWDIPLGKEVILNLSGQMMHQKHVGDALYGEFETMFGGFQTGVSFRGLSASFGMTFTDTRHDMVNPWGAWPGYTSIMEEDSDLAGEKAWVAGLTYDFSYIGLEGLRVNFEHTESYVKDGGSFSDPDQYETDMNVDYRFIKGALKGFNIRFRMAFVDHSLSAGDNDYSDYRLILNYDF